jgi:hypothetical protein
MKRPRQPLRRMPRVISPSQESSLQWLSTANYTGALTFENFCRSGDAQGALDAGGLFKDGESYKDGEPVGARTDLVDGQDGEDNVNGTWALSGQTAMWSRRHREATTLKVPSEAYASISAALAAAISGDVIEVGEGHYRVHVLRSIHSGCIWSIY